MTSKNKAIKKYKSPLENHPGLKMLRESFAKSRKVEGGQYYQSASHKAIQGRNKK